MWAPDSLECPYPFKFNPFLSAARCASRACNRRKEGGLYQASANMTYCKLQWHFKKRTDDFCYACFVPVEESFPSRSLYQPDSYHVHPKKRKNGRANRGTGRPKFGRVNKRAWSSMCLGDRGVPPMLSRIMFPSRLARIEICEQNKNQRFDVEKHAKMQHHHKC